MIVFIYPLPKRFELLRGNPMYLAGTRLNHSAKATRYADRLYFDNPDDKIVRILCIILLGSLLPDGDGDVDGDSIGDCQMLFYRRYI
jgi:hypothetical protein